MESLERGIAMVFRQKEIQLFGYYYPIISDIQDSLRQNFANKMVVGDYTKDSELDKSSVSWSDHTGGIGIKDMVEAKHANRCWFSTCELGYPGHLIPPPLAVNCGNPTEVEEEPM